MLERIPLPNDVMELVLGHASISPQEDAQRFGPVSHQFRLNIHRLWQRRFERYFPNLESISKNWPSAFHAAQKKENSRLTDEQIRLFYLASQGQSDAFIARNPSLDQFLVLDCHGNSLLDLAYMKKNLAIQDFCYEKALEFYAHPETHWDDNMNTLLHWAAYSGKTHLLHTLITPTMPVDVINTRSETPLRIAATRGHLDMVIELLRLGANPNLALGDFKTPLIISVARRYLPVVKVLLLRPVTEETLATVNKVVITMDDDTALVRAVKNYDVAMVAELVAYGANVNQPVEYGMTALHIAAREGHDKILQILLSAPNVAVNQTNKNLRTPLHLAAENGHSRCVSLLLSKPDIVVDGVDQFNSTPLYYASLSGDLGTVQRLLRGGANVNHIAKNCFTPVLAALARGHCDILQELIDHKADVNSAREVDGLTPFMFALTNLNSVDRHALEIILNAENFDIKQENKRYLKNLLHYAAEFGDANIVRLLLDKGVDKDHKNKYDETPFDIAKEEGYEEISLLLSEPKQHKL